jgi:hypothetical protein
VTFFHAALGVLGLLAFLAAMVIWFNEARY